MAGCFLDELYERAQAQFGIDVGEVRLLAINGRWQGPLCEALSWPQFQHPVVAAVGDVDVAGGIHRHSLRTV